VRSRIQTFTLLVPLAVVVGLFTIWPALYGLVYSFTSFDAFRNVPVHFTGLENYVRAFDQPGFRDALRNAVVLAFVSVMLQISLGTLVAFALRRPFRGRTTVRLLLLAPWLVSPIASGVMWHFLFNRDLGLINVLPALLGLPVLPDLRGPGLAMLSLIVIETWRKAPLVAFLVLPALMGVKASLWDLASLEGLSRPGVLRHVALPHLRGLLLTLFMLLVGDALGTFETVLMFTGGGPGNETITPGLFSYQQAFQTYNWSLGSSSAWVVAGSVFALGAVYLALNRREVHA
jgi:ABC-type sugar transport system permease subunit